jgi:flagellar motor switch protein FliM
MTRSPSIHVSRSSIRQLLAAVGSAGVRDEAGVEATPYNWRSPRCFTEEQYNGLAAVMSQVAAVLGTKLTHHFSKEVTVAPSSITQHFGAGLDELGIYGRRHTLVFGPTKDKPCGFLSLTTETALRWVRLLLGDSEPDEDPNRPLSSLEESLLGDLAVEVTNTFLSPLRSHQNLSPADRLAAGSPSIRFEPTQEICTLLFTVTNSDAKEGESDDMLFVAPCSILAPLVGKSRHAVQQISAEELSRILMEHIQQIPIMVTVRLASTRLGFGELLELGRDDILLLDRSLDEPIELLLDDRVIFRGRAARSGGQRAVLVTEPADNPGQKKGKSR